MSAMGKVHPVDSSTLSAPAIITRRGFTTDGFSTFDQFTIDSTGAFLNGELERLDPKLHEPLVAVTWGAISTCGKMSRLGMKYPASPTTASRRPAVSSPNGKSWISKDATNISGVALDIGKTVHPLYLWGLEIKYTLPELASAEQLGRSIDQQKHDGLRLKHQMDIDEQVYIGDATYGAYGMLNQPGMYVTNAAATGSGGLTTWASKTPQNILNDVNALLTQVWANSGYAIMPSELRLPPVQFGYLVSTIVSSAGNISVLEFLRNNSLSNAANGKPLEYSADQVADRCRGFRQGPDVCLHP